MFLGQHYFELIFLLVGSVGTNMQNFSFLFKLGQYYYGRQGTAVGRARKANSAKLCQVKSKAELGNSFL